MLPAGKYYIGDLCYVIEDWSTFCDMTLAGQTVLEGEINFKGTPIASYCTMWGDGVYSDEEDNEYSVDAGLIGCIPVDAVTKPDGLKFGRLVEFTEPFRTYSVNGKIVFGERRRQGWSHNNNPIVSIDTSN
jgi:hypothetical protein